MPTRIYKTSFRIVKVETDLISSEKFDLQMDDFPRRKREELIGTYGRGLCDTPQRREGLLLDYCGINYRPEINALVAPLEEHVASALLSSQATAPIAVGVP
jgi:hypothetical protein